MNSIIRDSLILLVKSIAKPYLPDISLHQLVKNLENENFSFFYKNVSTHEVRDEIRKQEAIEHEKIIQKQEKYLQELRHAKAQLLKHCRQDILAKESTTEMFAPLNIEKDHFYADTIQLLKQRNLYKKVGDIEFIRNYQVNKCFLAYDMCSFKSAEDVKLQYFDDVNQHIRTALFRNIQPLLPGLLIDVRETPNSLALAKAEPALTQQIAKYNRFSKQEKAKAHKILMARKQTRRQPTDVQYRQHKAPKKIDREKQGQ